MDVFDIYKKLKAKLLVGLSLLEGPKICICLHNLCMFCLSIYCKLQNMAGSREIYPSFFTAVSLRLRTKYSKIKFSSELNCCWLCAGVETGWQFAFYMSGIMLVYLCNTRIENYCITVVPA
jgi:hypothetical protein